MIEKIVGETLESKGMTSLMAKRGTVIVGFSGGADSTLLVHLLAPYTAKRGIRLVLAHVNHMIRGAEADEDEAFVRETAARLGLPVYVKRADVPRMAEEKGIGLEEAARAVRYAFFEELSHTLDGVVATAHNGDDHLETVLFHMMRGTGLRGLCGIAPVREETYIRPLIALSGEEIRNACRERGLAYRTDSTNTDTVYTRNYIRHEVVPKLRQTFDAPHKTVFRMTELLRRDSDYLEGEAARLCPMGRTVFPRDTLTTLHLALSSRVLRRMAVSLGGGDAPVPEQVHIDAMLTLAAGDKREGRIPLSAGAEFYVTRHEVGFRISVPRPDGEEKEETTVPMDINGSVFENERYKILISQSEHPTSTEEYENIYKLSIHKIMCSDKIIGSLYIKYRNHGDTYKVGGMTRRIKKMMIDRKLTAEEKRLLPLLCDDCGILWMPYGSLRDGADECSAGENCVHFHCFIK